MSESQPAPTGDPVLKPRQMKSFGGLLAAALLKAIGVFVLYYFIGSPVPVYPKVKEEAELRGAPITPELEARFAAVKASDEADRAAYHQELLIGGATVAAFSGLAFCARVAPFLSSVAALGLFVTAGLRTLSWDFAAILYDLVGITNTTAGSVSLAVSVLILATLVYAVLVSRVRVRGDRS